MNQDDVLKAGFQIHWFYSGKSSKRSLLYHHGHGLVRTVKLEVDDQFVSTDDIIQITDELANDLEKLWKEKVQNHVERKRRGV